MENLIKKLESLYQTHDRYEVLKDFFKLTAISLNNGSEIIHNKQWQQDENDYIATIKKYSKDEQNTICDCFALLVNTITKDIEQGVFKDWLGEIYMQSCTASKEKAQHFTPYSVGKMMAEMQVNGELEKLKKKKVIKFNDPCVGGGCLPIAFCDCLLENDINYQEKALLFCEDNDERCFFMSYIQLSLIGANAVIEWKDTLLNKNLGRKWHTPLLKMHYLTFKKYLR